MPNLYPETDEAFEKRELKAKETIKEYCEHSKELIEKINVTSIINEGVINPYLAKALGMGSIEEVVDFFIQRSAERSLGGSFGNALEKFIMHIFGGVSGKKIDPICNKRIKRELKPWHCWWDVLVNLPVEEDGKKYKGLVFAVKSGPSTTNDDIIKVFTQEAAEAEAQKYKPYLIGVYGIKASSGAISGLNRRGYSPEKYYRIGKEVFEEFLGKPDYYQRALELFGEFGLDDKISSLIENKKIEITNEFKEICDNDFDAFIEMIFNGNENNEDIVTLDEY